MQQCTTNRRRVSTSLALGAKTTAAKLSKIVAALQRPKACRALNMYQLHQIRVSDAFVLQSSSGTGSCASNAAEVSLPPESVAGRSSANGSDKEQVFGNKANDRMAAVEQELHLLRQTVDQQQKLIEQQQETIKDLSYMERQNAALVAGAIPLRPFDAQVSALGDGRYHGYYDARFSSIHAGATPRDFRVLPKRIILVRSQQNFLTCL